MSGVRFPQPLRPGDVIGVTSPSSGVAAALRPRLEASIGFLRERGYVVVVGDCMSADRVTSAPKHQRAAELTQMLTDPAVRAVVPPWGGELGIDLVDLLDWDAIAAAEPTWAVGFSNTTVWTVPLTLRVGWATLHGWNLMDTRYAAPDGLLHWLDVAESTGPLTQRSPGRWRRDWDDYEAHPAVSRMTLPEAGTWTVTHGDSEGRLDVTGRLIGGCLEIVSALAGTPYADVPAFGRAHTDDGLVVYLEAAEHGAYDVARALHGLRLAGWFDDAVAVLIGRTTGPDAADLTQHEAVLDALGDLGVPIVLDVEVGHTQPNMSLVNGALARVVVDGGRREITQTLR